MQHGLHDHTLAAPCSRRPLLRKVVCSMNLLPALLTRPSVPPPVMLLHHTQVLVRNPPRSSPHQCMFMPPALLPLGPWPSPEASSRSMRARSYTCRMFPEVMSQSLKYDWITPCNSRFLASSSEACSHHIFPETWEALSTRVLHQKMDKPHKREHRGSQESPQGAEQARLPCCNEAPPCANPHRICHEVLTRCRGEQKSSHTALTALRRSDTAATLRSLASS